MTRHRAGVGRYRRQGFKDVIQLVSNQIKGLSTGSDPMRRIGKPPVFQQIRPGRDVGMQGSRCAW